MNQNESKIRVGVVGVGRGSSMMAYCNHTSHAKLVAICDKWEEGLMAKKAEFNDPDIAYYTDYETFLTHDMDVVILANYANEHAPFAIRAMNAGFHVISEVLPCQTMAEAVELVETVERTGKIYCYAENYCYMKGTREMRRLYREGLIGELEYCEGEYVHNCEPCWTDITYGDPDHWRNNMFGTFYCTHSMGPLVHITGLRPVKVSAFELPYTDCNIRMGRKSPLGGLEIVTFENGAIAKSVHGDLQRNNVWYTMYGSKGRVECPRECTGSQDLYVEFNEFEGDYSKMEKQVYVPEDTEEAAAFGHGGSDYHTIWNAIERIKGNPDTDTIDVYEALDMYLPGLLGHRSVLAGGAPVDIPNLRNPEEREAWRHDHACTDPKVASGKDLLPTYSKGTPEIPAASYERHQRIWAERHSKR